MRWLIKGGMVIDPANQFEGIADVLVEEGKIAAVLPGGAGKRGSEVNPGSAVERGTADEEAVVDASGLLVLPGLVDMHVHLREPGYERKETIASGTRAAARGGFTTVVCMPNTLPVADSRAIIEFIRRQAEATGVVNVYPVGAITKGAVGQELAEIADLWEGGAVAVSDDGRPVMNAEIMRRALEYVKIVGFPVISHCEDLNLSEEGQIHEGYWSMLLGLKGIPSAAEEVMVARDLILTEASGSRLHLAHVSTAGSVRMLREAKARGVAVTAEVTPHHLVLTDAATASFDTATKVNPPLRAESDRQALLEALREGIIDAIATDHAPHTLEEKDCEYDLAPFGISGLETAFPLLWTYLVEKGELTATQLVASMTCRPARILNLPKGTLSPGADADITLVDPRLEIVVDKYSFISRGKNTPFHGWKLKGWPVATMVKGQWVMRNRQLLI